MSQLQPSTGNFEASVAQVARDLADSLDRVLAALPGGPRGPQGLAELLAVDKGFASRLLKAIRSRDPLAVAHQIPGVDPLRRLLKACARRGVPDGLLSEARACIEQFENLVLVAAGDRSTFDGIIAHWLPDARRQFESRNKQLLYRGFSQLKGFTVDVDFTTVFLLPSSEVGFVDYVVLFGVLGLRRLRPGAEVRLATWLMFHERTPWQGISTLDGRPLEHWTAGRLDEFCSAPPPHVHVREFGDGRTYVLSDESFGPNASADLVLAQVSRNTAPIHSEPPQRRFTGVGAEVDKPARLLHLDIFVHQSVYPGVDPEVHMIDTAFRGMANINDPQRKPDWYDLDETITSLGSDPARFRTPHIHRYPDMLEAVSRGRGCPLGELRGYRLLIEHPIYGMQAGMGFKRPFATD